MRRDVLITAVKKISEDLEVSGLRAWLASLISTRRINSKATPDPVNTECFDVFQKYSILSSSYGEVERSVLNVMNLRELSDSSYWVGLLDIDSNDVYKAHSNVRFAIDQLPKVLALLSQDYVEEMKEGGSAIPSELKGKMVLSVVLVEDRGQFSSPARLIYALESMTKLYSVVAHLEGVGESDLAILAIDSGSDKSFDFLGLAKVMEEVKSILLGIWDRRVFHRHMHVSQCMDLIAKSLPIIERIEELKVSGALGVEQAEILKRKTLEGATQFLEAGAFIGEMGEPEAHSPRQLMRPEPKLLAGPMELGNQHAAPDETKIMHSTDCLLYTSPSPRDATLSRMPSSA